MLPLGSIIVGAFAAYVAGVVLFITAMALLNHHGGRQRLWRLKWELRRADRHVDEIFAQARRDMENAADDRTSQAEFVEQLSGTWKEW